jgi:ornithine cyclodeaminase/alanine dehydrogenase-like protein (mu-crystallin family)
MTAPRFLSPEDIHPHLSISMLIAPMEQAFRATSSGQAQSMGYVLAPTDGADIHVKSASIAGSPVFTIKMAGWSRVLADRGEVPSSGMIVVFDALTCRPLAILQDDHLISDYRTAAAGALAARLLSRQDAAVAAVIGTGMQARLQAQAVCLVRPIRKMLLWGRRREAASELARLLAADLPEVMIEVSETAESAVRAADIIVTATSSRDPILPGHWLRPGQHVTSVGADDATKCELFPDVLDRADRVFVDSLTAARSYGNIHHALRINAPVPDHKITEIGQLLESAATGRLHDRDITVASFSGLGVQDLTAVTTLFDFTGTGADHSRT